ncbi:MAG: NAD(+) diphosphatase [Rhodovibrionaceae bacterium]
MPTRPTPERNFYSSDHIDRAEDRRRDPAWLAASLSDGASRFVPVWQAKNLLQDGDPPRPALLTADQAAALALGPSQTIFLGLAAGVPHFALDLSTLETPDHHPALAGRGHFTDLRNVGPLLPREQGCLLAYARGMVYWASRHRFCGCCGTPTESSDGGHQRRCPNPGCGAPHFPRTDPAIIVLVHDGGERCVLGRQAVWPPGMHSTLAGFVEPGESLEDAVAREIMEEVGLPLDEITYLSSQPWPFPSSLMLGFHARASDDRLKIDEVEIESARWFTREEMLNSPEDETFKLPRRDSIARRLIEEWLRE